MCLSLMLSRLEVLAIKLKMRKQAKDEKGDDLNIVSVKKKDVKCNSIVEEATASRVTSDCG